MLSRPIAPGSPGDLPGADDGRGAAFETVCARDLLASASWSLREISANLTALSFMTAEQHCECSTAFDNRCGLTHVRVTL